MTEIITTKMASAGRTLMTVLHFACFALSILFAFVTATAVAALISTASPMVVDRVLLDAAVWGARTAGLGALITLVTFNGPVTTPWQHRRAAVMLFVWAASWLVLALLAGGHAVDLKEVNG